MQDLIARCSDILAAVAAAGGQALIVGGAVRDALLGYTTSDIDLEVYGIEPAPLRELLERHGHVEAVGRAFAVLKVRRADGSFVDIALPRAESSSGRRGVVGGMPDMLPRDAAARRDFSCNALALTADGELLDFYGGVADLHAGVLRHVSPAFADDPLRVLRAMRLAARFNMQLAPATAEFCRTLVPRAAELPLERIWGEWRQWSERGAYPAAGLRVLAASGWLACYPQIQALDGCAQHHLYHPEGDVFVHTGLVCDAAAQIATREQLNPEARSILLFAALCHDFGKPATTRLNDQGQWRSPGHAQAGAPLAAAFMAQIGSPARLTNTVVPLVREHMAHLMRHVTPRAVRRLAVRLAPASISQWEHLLEADFSGRPPCPPGRPGLPIAELAATLHAASGPPAPLVQGRDLLAVGFSGSPALGRILRAAYGAQIDGVFDTTAAGVRWVQEQHPLQ